MRENRFLARLISSIWIINALATLGIGSTYMLLRTNRGEAAALSASTVIPETQTTLPSNTVPPASATPRPTDTRWPTLTRTPTPTITLTATSTVSQTPGPSPTPSAASIRPTRGPHDPADVLPTPTNESIIGYSVAGRPLEMFRFGSGETGRLIIAGIHGGNEGNTVLLAYELIDHLTAHPEMIPKNITLYILPDLNPDGFARGRGLDGRVNDHGVDLNRNWPWNWQKDWPRGGCWNYRPVTGGVLALSEPETLAMYRFIVEHPEIDALISYHAAALGIFAGGVPDYRPSISLANTVDGVSTYDYPPIDTHCAMTGDLTDWAATWHIAAVDIELDNFRYTDFEDNLAILRSFLKWHR